MKRGGEEEDREERERKLGSKDRERRGEIREEGEGGGERG